MTDLRAKAAALFSVACVAADPAHALHRALLETPLPRPDPGGAFLVIAVGKAAIPMARALLDHLRDQPCTVLVVANYQNACPVPGATVMAAGHSVPDENGARAAEAVEGLLATSTAKDQVIALISGGGSALEQKGVIPPESKGLHK